MKRCFGLLLVPLGLLVGAQGALLFGAVTDSALLLGVLAAMAGGCGILLWIAERMPAAWNALLIGFAVVSAVLAAVSARGITVS